MSSKTTNLNLTKPSEDEFYDINVQNENMDIIDREINGLKQPAYEVSTAMSDLNSGEMITVAFGKIAKAVSTLISHVASKATSSVLGHVKLSDSTSSTSASTAGVAATPKAVKAAYDLANSNTEKLGTTDISGIGDGTVTGAIVNNKEAIEDVSQSLAKLNNKGLKTLNSNYASYYYKNGNTVYIVADFANKTVPQNGVTLGTLPIGYRPYIEVYGRNGFDNQNGEMMVNRSGVVKLQSASGSFNYGHFSCCFPCTDTL